jgi:uncharacterized protein
MKRTLTLLMCVVPAICYSKTLNNEEALKGLSAVNIICDVNVGDADLLLRRLELIDETYTELLDAGVKPTIVVAFRGEASRFVTKNDKYIKPEQEPTHKKIQGWIDQFAQNGFRLEQCAIAAKTWGIDPSDILPQVTLVQNGYISLVGYQNKGYALLPMD